MHGPGAGRCWRGVDVRSYAVTGAPRSTRGSFFGIDRAMPVAKAAQLRRKAALCRRAASIPTEGSSQTNRLLLDLAERLEREAAALEKKDTDLKGG